LLGNVGSLTAERIRQATVMRLDLPPAVKDALENPAGAAAVVYALLLGDDEAVRARQWKTIQAALPAAWCDQFSAISPPVLALSPRFRLMVAELAVPALRGQTEENYTRFVDTTQALVEADGAIDLFEYAVLKMVKRQLQSAFEGPAAPRQIYGRVQDVLPQCALVLSALAHVGAEDESAARKAFTAGSEFLDAPGSPITFLARSQWDLQQVDAALNRLSRCPPAVQRNVLLACGKTVAADGEVTEREAELLRAVADSLNCPMPPFVEALRSEEVAKP